MRGHRPRGSRSTPPGQHVPIMLSEVMACLAPKPADVMLDCTVGWGGHAAELARAIGPTGRLIGLDLDAENLPKAVERLAPLGTPYSLHQANFAAASTVIGLEQLDGVDGLLADLGMSSMQLDDPARGFSYRRDGPLDMRMDRGRGSTAAQLLAKIPEEELSLALDELGDEPDAKQIARTICAARQKQPLETTRQLALLLEQAVLGKAGVWKLRQGPGEWLTHPAARVFQVLRILVNRELASLSNLLRTLPGILRPGGRAAIISFHSGEDRLVKESFKLNRSQGAYLKVSDEPMRASYAERGQNPRSRSAKLRWAVRA